MWLKKMKQKKVQFVLIAAILCFTAAIFSACISFTVETDRFTNQYFSYNVCPIQFNIINGKVDGSILTENKDIMQLLDKVTVANAKYYDASLYIDGKNVKNSSTFFYELESTDRIGYQVMVLDGDRLSKSPKNGEIWVCSVGATANDIKLGDQISIGKTGENKLTVSAIVSTPICPSGFMGVYPYYVNKKTLASIEGMDATAVNLFAKTESITLEEINKLLPSSFNDSRLFNIDAKGLMMSTSMLTNIFGGIGIIAALVVFVVSIVIIRFLIKSTLVREMKLIGTYKSLGFKTGEIIGFYMKCYLFSGSIGITMGVLLGVPLSAYIGSIATKELGAFHLTFLSLMIAMITIILLCTILSLNVFFELIKIKKITPVQALLSGTSSSKEKLKKPFLKYAMTSFSMAINDIFRKKSMSILIIFILTVSFYLSTLFSCVNYTLREFKNNQDLWFAFPNYDGSIEIKADEDVESYLKQSKYIKDYTLANLGLSLAGAKSESTDIDLSNISIFPFTKLNENVFDVPLFEGRLPQHPLEMIVSLDFLEIMNLKVGDYFNINTTSANKNLLITGSYSSMYNGGKTIIIRSKDYESLGFITKNEHAMIFLKNKEDYTLFEEEFEQTFEMSYLIKELSFVEPTVKSLNLISNPITSALVMIFVLFSIINIVNLLWMNNIEYRRQYGILKAMGFTSRDICMQSLSKITLLSSVAVIFTVILHLTVSPILFFSVIKVKAFETAPLLFTIVVSLLFLVVLFVTLLFALPLKKISPTELMEE